MSTWKTYRVTDAVKDIEDGKFVLPVIQRRFVWSEEKMELLFDTLLKGDSFGGIMVIEEEKDSKPLFSFRNFTKDGNPIDSNEVDLLSKSQYFVIDGQQRLQTFYIGLTGSMNGKQLYFDLFSNFEEEFEFKFSNNTATLPKIAKDITNRKTEMYNWYSVKSLLDELKRSNNDRAVSKKIIKQFNIQDENLQDLIDENVAAFYRNVISGESLGISLVAVDKTLPDVVNRQKIVELFRRLNDGGTRLSGFDLVASILKGFDWRMEEFIDHTLKEYTDIGVSQDNFIKLLFVLQNNTTKEMADITAVDSTFAVEKKDRILACLESVRKFLKYAELYTYYSEGGKSFIPIFFIVYHLFYKDLSNEAIKSYFDNYDTGNKEFSNMKKWIYLSLINGIFRSRGAGWVPYKTGIKKLLEVIKPSQNQLFPYSSIILMYKNYGLVFTDDINETNVNQLDRNFIFYLIYNKTQTIRLQDIDHVHPKSILETKGYSTEEIFNIFNYQLIDSGTNRWEKNAMPFAEWVNKCVKDKDLYLSRHLIPKDENLWEDENYKCFLSEREKLFINKIHENGI